MSFGNICFMKTWPLLLQPQNRSSQIREVLLFIYRNTFNLKDKKRMKTQMKYGAGRKTVAKIFNMTNNYI